MPDYVFPGLRPFQEAAASAKGRDLHQLGRAIELWHCKQVQNDLGQLPALDPASKREILAHAVYVREGLACALEGVDAAIREVCEACGLPIPPPVLESAIHVFPHVNPSSRPAGPESGPEPELFDTAIRRRFSPP